MFVKQLVSARAQPEVEVEVEAEAEVEVEVEVEVGVPGAARVGESAAQHRGAWHPLRLQGSDDIFD